jgi:Na+/pantothenate symporter|uniref:Sodium-dependent multivitamin transporter n=1 Tax=Mus musculus TaxID=10090 RepID=Q3UNW0_MOUSE|nr:unnamed protein product [Mus musculus]
MRVKNFEAWDYVVFAGLFVISSGIGVFFAIKERKKTTSREFLVGGRQMSFGPVALSLTASFMSAVTVLGTPAEVYRFGASFFLFLISYVFVVFFTSELFLPVFYRSGITSTYEVRDHLPAPITARRWHLLSTQRVFLFLALLFFYDILTLVVDDYFQGNSPLFKKRQYVVYGVGGIVLGFGCRHICLSLCRR